MAIKKEMIAQFVKLDTAIQEILAKNVKDLNLQDLLLLGFAICHGKALQSTHDPPSSYLHDGSVQVPVCAMTLAWGISTQLEQLRAVYIEPYQEMVDLCVKEWTLEFQKTPWRLLALPARPVLTYSC